MTDYHYAEAVAAQRAIQQRPFSSGIQEEPRPGPPRMLDAAIENHKNIAERLYSANERLRDVSARLFGPAPPAAVDGASASNAPAAKFHELSALHDEVNRQLDRLFDLTEQFERL